MIKLYFLLHLNNISNPSFNITINGDILRFKIMDLQGI